MRFVICYKGRNTFRNATLSVTSLLLMCPLDTPWTCVDICTLWGQAGAERRELGLHLAPTFTVPRPHHGGLLSRLCELEGNVCVPGVFQALRRVCSVGNVCSSQ